ncbi:MAG TPA: preprotein translocase subunit YajC, partial [bacterium]|nr:preprotein translocase subunit YajC [bacterium]
MDSAYAQTTSSTTAPAKPAPGAGAPTSGLFSFAPFIAIMVVFYFLMIYPQNKERKKKEEMLGGIQRGDRVLTRGGIYGTVADIKEQVLILKISENSKVEVDRSYVETV